MTVEVRLRLSHRNPEDIVEAAFSSISEPGEIGAPEISVEAPFKLQPQFLLESIAGDLSLKNYGTSLSDALFAGEIKDRFLESWGTVAQRRRTSPAAEDVLRVRIRYDPSWNSVAWETLFSPINRGTFVSLDQNVTLTREVPGRSRGHLVANDFKKALVMVANPQMGDAQHLPPINVKETVTTALECLAGTGLKVTEISAVNDTTWEQLSAKFDEGFDVWFLVCHGAVDDSHAWIFLTNPDGSLNAVDVAKIEERVHALRRKPSLVFLLSCHSASTPLGIGSPGCKLAWALAPRLVRTGIPAVIAMQGEISQQTAIVFSERALSALRNTGGDVESAVAAGRQHARAAGYADWWSPCLFSLAGAAPLIIRPDRKFRNWESIKRWIETGQCIPILGFGIGESLFGPVRQLVQHVAEQWKYPEWENTPTDLPTVAQYVTTIMKDVDFPKESLLTHVCQEIISNQYDQLDEVLRGQLLAKPPARQSVDELHATIRQIAGKLRGRPDDPYRIVASLPCKYFITTMPDDLLEDALRGETSLVQNQPYPRHPFSQTCDWDKARQSITQEARHQEQLREIANLYSARTGKSVSASEADLEKLISVDRPYVYHLFGRLDPISSWVLTEDNYLDFLSSVSRENPVVIPTHLTSAITRSALLFLGFEINQWSFRIMLQIISKAIRSGNKANVAVQLNANGQSVAMQKAAMEYLAKRFEQFARIDIYWGSAQQFLAELNTKM